MRILHAGNFGTSASRAKGAALHSVAAKLSRGLIRAGHHVVDYADRDVARAATPLGARKFGRIGANRALLQLAEALRPELLILGHADMILPATLRDLRRAHPAMRVLQWSVDPLFEPGPLRRLRARLPHVDATLVSCAGEALRPLQHPGMRLGFLPNPVDFSLETGAAHEAAQTAHDLFFACGNPSRPLRQLFGTAWDCEALIADLRRRVPELRPLLAGLAGRAHLAGQAYQEAMAGCAAGLNLSRRNDVPLYSSDRLAQMAGNGLAVLIAQGTGYERLFSPAEMLFFGSLEELATLLRRIRLDPSWRQHVAAAGRLRYHALFNETRVARYLVEAACGSHDPKDYEWPTLLG